MTTYYLYDPTTKVFAGAVSAVTQPENATTVAVPDGLYQPTFDGQTWQGITADEYAKQSEQPPAPVPTTEQESLTALAKQLADQQQHIVSLEKALTALAQGGTNS